MQKDRENEHKTICDLKKEREDDHKTIYALKKKERMIIKQFML
jgi:hypothetical protein